MHAQQSHRARSLTTAETERFIQSVPSDVVVVIDEAYQEFVRASDAVDGIAMYRKYPNVVVLRTFSKAHGLAGLRVGYSVSRPELTQHLRVAATPFAVSQLAETAAVASLAEFRRGCRKGTKPGGRTRPRHGGTARPWLVRPGGAGQLRLAGLWVLTAPNSRRWRGDRRSPSVPSVTRASGSASGRPRPTPASWSCVRTIQSRRGVPSA